MKTGSLHRSLFLFAAMGITPLALGQTAPPVIHPPEDFKQWAVLSHKLEANPLDPQVNRDAEVAVREIRSSPDFHTPLCSSFFTFFNKLTMNGYIYQAQIYRLYTLGSAAYRIETGKTDAYGTNLYAFDSVLKAYSVMVKKDPGARDRTLEELYVTALRGKLPEYLQKDSTCK